MSNISQSITALCHQLIEKPTNIKTENNEQYHKVREKAKKDPISNQEIVLESREDSFYVHVKSNICITLYKELSMENKFTDIDKPVLEKLNKERQIIASQ